MYIICIYYIFTKQYTYIKNNKNKKLHKLNVITIAYESILTEKNIVKFINTLEQRD